jgi:hypothetical protein
VGLRRSLANAEGIEEMQRVRAMFLVARSPAIAGPSAFLGISQNMAAGVQGRRKKIGTS